ncbi:transglutaminase domain-containing protein [Bacillus sp. RG28]|uniref:Transglutaminase domain-containing protein n=1 Tax=Gottfriedia endophytica TaxID=2820819 RepID=A0A940NJ93_9BACI|nr:transglutaminase domain-containing protein [Gottfriedia endophytica]MBP0726354.1 transglutaminase domain-containing protein [Gottfriedia endophytica]
MWSRVGRYIISLVIINNLFFLGNVVLPNTIFYIKMVKGVSAEVTDTEPPIIKGAHDLTVFVGDTVSYGTGITVTDNTDKQVELKIDSSAVNLNKVGHYQVVYSATDLSGNKTSISITIYVKADTEPPKIKGVQDQTVFVGDPISYKKNVTVTDNRDKQVELKIDSSAVNLKKVGDYHVIYSATDLAGNKATVTSTIHVKKVDVKTEVLNKEADKVLAKITKNNMTQIEKAWAIFNWAKKNIAYTGHSDKSDWMAGAMRGFKQGNGDCFNYYATSRILLTRAGIENQTVTRVGGKTLHYWNLVKIGGGWYHFDTTPTKKPYTGFLRTDAEVAARSKIIKGYYNFDKTKHPATPLKPLKQRSAFLK